MSGDDEEVTVERSTDRRRSPDQPPSERATEEDTPTRGDDTRVSDTRPPSERATRTTKARKEYTRPRDDARVSSTRPPSERATEEEIRPPSERSTRGDTHSKRTEVNPSSTHSSSEQSTRRDTRPREGEARVSDEELPGRREELQPGEKFCQSCGCPTSREQSRCVECGTDQHAGGERDRLMAVFLAVTLGAFGGHRFYLGDEAAGTLYLCTCWTGVPLVVGLVEAVNYLLSSDETFEREYVNTD